MNYCKLILGGRLVRDPEIRVTQQGTAICQFGVATSRKFKDASGAEREETTFIDCEAWGKVGEIIGKNFTKGKAIFLDCRIKQDTWEDKNTKEKRSKLKAVVENFQFVGPREDAAPKPQQQTSASAPTPGNIDEDVPF